MTQQPSLFISHGAPTLVLDASPARDFLERLGTQLERPKAILIISAHFDARNPTLTSGAAPRTIHDFGGFGPEMHAMQYPAPGDPGLAERAAAMLRASGLDAVTDGERGLDHGAWVPLKLAYPEADIPVVQLSISMNQSPEWHYRLGQAIAPLRDEGVLIIGSGGTTHNLRAFFTGSYKIDSDAPEWVTLFSEWVAEKVAANDRGALIEAVEQGPMARQNHPSMDHILPFFVALGAGGEGAGERLHQSTTYGVLAMDAHRFGGEVAAQLSSLDYGLPKD